MKRIIVVLCSILVACAAVKAAPHMGSLSLPVYQSLSATGPDAAATTVIGSSLGGLGRYDKITVDCSITTGTGDASVPLDVYLQKLAGTSYNSDSGVTSNVWVDFVHFPKQSVTPTSATATYNVATDELDQVPLAVGVGTDTDAGTLALDAGLIAHGHPGDTLRLVIVTGAGVIYTPASVACYFYGH